MHDALHSHTVAVDELTASHLKQGWLPKLKQLTKRTAQTCRLMVGIHDYDNYLAHMHSQHPEAKPYTRDEFYRYCLEARFPNANSKGTRCPC